MGTSGPSRRHLCFSGLTRAEKDQATGWAGSLGFEVHGDLTDHCTQVVADSVCSEKARAAVRMRIPVVSLAWLDVEPETAEAAWARRELDLKAEQALAEVRRWMEEHDVHFDGAMDPRVRESKLGVPQAWAIDSLDEAKAKANRQLLDGIADVMKTHPALKVFSGFG
mgnify:CR=1 FL=1